MKYKQHPKKLDEKIKIALSNKNSIMKFDAFPGEKEILSFRLANGAGWLTTHRLIIQKEKKNLRFNIVEKQDPEIYLLCEFEKAEIKNETLTAHFKTRQKAEIRLESFLLSLLQDIKNYIEEAAKCAKS